MKASIYKSEVKGKVVAPASKSYTIRGLMCAALAMDNSEIINPLSSDDTEASIDVLGRVGVSIRQAEDFWQVFGGGFHEPNTDLFCRESAATFRFMTAICSLIPGKCRLVPAPTLARRPMEPLVQALGQLGVECSYHKEEAAIEIQGGKFRGGTTSLPGNISSQFVSALLFIAPLAEEGIRIRLTTPLESHSFVLMTVECLKMFGIKVEFARDMRQFEISRQTYKPAKYRVEGDWSSASYLLAAGALAGEVEVENLNPESRQGDRVILDFLKDMGAMVIAKKDSVTVRKSRLNGINADLSNCIDLLPTMAVLSAAADGVSEFTGIGRARLKESDRVSAVSEGLEGMGIKAIEERNKLTIIGGRPKGSVIDTRGDHRIAMAFGLLGSVTGDTIIDDAECIAKTYPEFWNELKSLGGEVKVDGQ